MKLELKLKFRDLNIGDKFQTADGWEYLKITKDKSYNYQIDENVNMGRDKDVWIIQDEPVSTKPNRTIIEAVIPWTDEEMEEFKTLSGKKLTKDEIKTKWFEYLGNISDDEWNIAKKVD